MICIDLQGTTILEHLNFSFALDLNLCLVEMQRSKAMFLLSSRHVKAYLCGLQTAIPDEGIIQGSIISQRKPRLQSK